MPAEPNFLSGRRIDPMRIDGRTDVATLIDGTFAAYNAGRLREGCRLFTERMLEDDVTVGLSLTGALTPAGLGVSALIPLIEAGFVDWIVATGGNLYHDAHFGLGLPLHQGTPFVSDTELDDAEVVRIYDIFFDYDVLLDTDAFFRRIIRAEEFQRRISTAEFHHLCGKYIAERARALGRSGRSLLAACHEYDVPVYSPSPGDSSIGMNVAAAALQGNRLEFDVSADVNETAAILLDARRRGAGSAALVLGGGSPKNFLLQTEAQIQEVLGIVEKGHDYFLQFTDARPDTGSLSGATPVDGAGRGADRADGHGYNRAGGHGYNRAGGRGPSRADGRDPLPSAVVCYADATIALPLLTAYALARRELREPKRLFRRRGEMLERLREEHARSLRDETIRLEARHGKGHQVTLDRNR